MICPTCKNEIGNQSRCPYCGTVFQTVENTVQINQPQTRESDNVRHMSNIDTWSLLQVVLLGGIFVTNILELVLLLAN